MLVKNPREAIAIASWSITSTRTWLSAKWKRPNRIYYQLLSSIYPDAFAFKTLAEKKGIHLSLESLFAIDILSKFPLEKVR